jgi:uncharacterized protein
MNIEQIIQSSILTPGILFFILGIIAARVKSDLKIPESITAILSIFLLASIGLHGGLEIRNYGIENTIVPISIAFAVGIVMTINQYAILKYIGKLNIYDSAALAGTYGSVSVATFSVGLSFLNSQGIESEGYLAAILAVLEPTGLIVGVLLANLAVMNYSKKRIPFTNQPARFDKGNLKPLIIVIKKIFSYKNKKDVSEKSHADPHQLPNSKSDQYHKDVLDLKLKDESASSNIPNILRETITGKAILVLVGSLVIGYLIGTTGFSSIKIVFEDAFKAALVFYLLEMGIIAGQRLSDIKKSGIFLILYATLIPTFNGIIGTIIATLMGLSVGGSLLFGLLLASASYIAAPAVLRIALPKANPSLYITSALGITFPYNVLLNMPMLYTIALALSSLI